jgi:8-oxo-dGTP pyrophosphatase MutT (NUDIX family)
VARTRGLLKRESPGDGISSYKEGEVSVSIPWKVLARRTLVERRYLELRQEHVQLASGQEIEDFYVIDMSDWAAVLCVTRSHEVVLVRQYRHGIAKESIELPAGALEAGEAPEVAAKRELLEETGYVSSRWCRIASLATDPSRQTAHAHFFCALDAERVREPRLDDAEELTTMLVSPGELVELVESGQIVHGMHIAAILLAARRGLLPASR